MIRSSFVKLRDLIDREFPTSNLSREMAEGQAGR